MTVPRPSIRVRRMCIVFPPSVTHFFWRSQRAEPVSDDSVAAQRRDVTRAHAEPFAEHFGRVLAEQRGRLEIGRAHV